LLARIKIIIAPEREKFTASDRFRLLNAAS
jgi:hypothetical protein